MKKFMIDFQYNQINQSNKRFEIKSQIKSLHETMYKNIFKQIRHHFSAKTVT